MNNIKNKNMAAQKRIPKEKCIDSTLALLKEGYLFISNRMNKFNLDIFETRLFFKKTICISGAKAAETFYNPEYFIRKSAAPKRIQKTLTGENSVQGTDGTEHLHRKALFMSVAGLENQKKLADLAFKEWQNAAQLWQKQNEVNLFEESKRLLCKIACNWAEVPLNESEIKQRADDFAAMVEGFGAVGAAHNEGKKARQRTEKWIQEIIQSVRNGQININKDSVLSRFALYKQPHGQLLGGKIAAIELINILRPIVAISTYVTFAALALYEHPEQKAILAQGDDKTLECFVQEVRRFYPFTPFVGAKVKKDFLFNNYLFTKNTLVLLDIYGMNHDEKIWKNPYEFNPDRFKERGYSPFEFMPQGGGNATESHRCPGDGITVEILKATLDFLTTKIEYSVPLQSLDYILTKIPTLPKSGFIINEVKVK